MILVEERDVRYRAKKDKRRWCKGRVGKEHEYHLHFKPWQINSMASPVRKLTKVWTRCVHCGRKDDYIGIYSDDESWTVRRSRWRTEVQTREFQKLVDEYLAQRNKSDAIAS